MNKATKIFLIVFFSVLFAAFVLVFSLSGLVAGKGNPYGSLSVDNGWIINKTEITIDVNKDRSANVVEKYEVNFIEPSYSMYRALPLSQKERYYNVKGSVKESSCDYYTETGFFSDAGKDILVLYIDMPSRQTGVFNFEISYKVIPRTEFANTDRFYMNIVGHGWTTAQSDVSVTVKYPAEIKAESSAIYRGRWGVQETLDSGNVAINGNTLNISGVSLAPFNGLTADFVFPKSTFDFYFDFYVLLALVLGLALLFVVYIVKNIKAKNEPLTPVVNFYPPKDEDGRELTPMDIGFLIDNNCEPEDVTSMIYYFASKGYLRINEEEKQSITLEKIRELPPKAQHYETAIFNAIFKTGPVATMSMLERSFPPMVPKAQSMIKSKYSDKTFEKSNSSLSLISMIGVWLVASLYIILSYFRISKGIMLLPLGLIAPILVIKLFGSYIFTRYHKFSQQKKFGMFLAYGLAALVLGAISAILLGGAVMGYTERAIFIALVMAAAMVTSFLNKRTDYYTKRLDDILGFKNFLETTEKDRLEKLISANPSYYYDILPYANVLGVSDIWQNKFKALQVAPPMYYSTNSNVLFNVVMFNLLFRSSIGRINSSIRTANRNNTFGNGGRGGFGGGGFKGGGGGGFSGGGFGGGGGGRR